MLEKKDYIARIKKAKRKRNRNDYSRYLILAGAGAVIIAALVFIGVTVRGLVTAGAGKHAAEMSTMSEAVNIEAESMALNEASEESQEEEEIQSVVDSYQNLGIVQVSGYLNVRKEPGTDADIIGKLLGESACEILETTDNGWYKISSGGIEGYILSEFVLTGDQAKEKAIGLVRLRAVIETDNLNIRKEPSIDSDIVAQAIRNERYEVLGQTEGWVQIPSGYISSDYVELKYALNEARKLDLKAMVFNLYDNLGISKVDNFLNVREQPSEDGKVIGKMTSKSAGNILETTDNGWYKIQSGGITGYVKSDYILTGAPAKEEALQVAELMAIVNTDMLNARSEPSTDSKIWTQISNNERYAVLKQVDGWVEIELEQDSNAYVASEFVDVRYALPEAIKFSPLEEKANAAASLRTQIVNYALRFLGNPYVWGGTSLTKGADCSGFVLSVFKNFGISLPHYSGSQAQLGKAVTSSEMRPGDLVFYANSRGTINHVGIYIGNGQIVNAASKRSGIKISNWNYRKPVRIRNILGD